MNGGKPFWVPSAIRSGRRLIDAGRYAVIVSFAMPWSSHLVAQELARRSGLPWVAHFSDPWVDSPYFTGRAFSRWLLRCLEASVIRRADAVIFVAERSADLVMRKYPDAWRRKVRIIPHGYDPEVVIPRPLSQPNGRLRLVHTGGLYSIRTPDPFLRGLAALARNSSVSLADRLEVLFVGHHDPAYRNLAAHLGLDEVVQFRPPCSYGEALRLVAEADVCLLVDAASPIESVFLPSKLIDYLMLRKPILGITPPQGESADLLRRVGCPVASPEDVPGIAQAVDDLLKARELGSLRVSQDYHSVAAEYDARNTARLFDAALREI
jgi:glycosyltransferase involved in cell wall biosynthesis